MSPRERRAAGSSSGLGVWAFITVEMTCKDRASIARERRLFCNYLRSSRLGRSERFDAGRKGGDLETAAH